LAIGKKTLYRHTRKREGGKNVCGGGHDKK
jgi:hypothetical protein